MATQTALARKYTRGLAKGSDVYGHIPTVLFTLARDGGTGPIYVRAEAAAMYDLLGQLRDGTYAESSDLSTQLQHARQFKLLAGAGYITQDHEITPHGEALIHQEESPVSEISMPVLTGTRQQYEELNPWDDARDGEPLGIEPLIIGDEAQFYVNCAACGTIYREIFPVDLYESIGCSGVWHIIHSVPIPPLCGLCQLPKLHDLDEEDEELALPTEYTFIPTIARAAEALDRLATDPAVIVRGGRADIEVIRDSLIRVTERCGMLTEQVEHQRSIIEWWQREAKAQRERFEQTNEAIMQLQARILDLSGPRNVVSDRLTRADLERIDDLTWKHTGHRLFWLLTMLDFDNDPELFRDHYPALDEALAIIGKRVIDHHLPVMAYAARSKRAKNQTYYLELHWGFGVVNVFDAEIKSLFADYPHDIPYTDPAYDAELNPPVEIVLEHDARNHPRIKSLRIVS